MSYRCAVMGNPIAHSQSPTIHAQFAQEQGIDLVYDKILVPLEGFAPAVEAFFQQGGTGLNVTVPFKVQAFELAEECSAYAQYAGAVNTLYQRQGKLIGENTDGLGLVKALIHTHGYSLSGRSVLLLGAGGAARGVVYPLLQAGVTQLLIANRTLSKAQAIVSAHQGIANCQLSACALDDLPNQPFDCIINATSTGLSDNALTLPNTILNHDSVCYDMVYGRVTPFMQWATPHCQQVYDGYSMLVAQARISFRHWFAC